MKNSRIALFALAAIVGLAALTAPAPASADDWSWLANKPYLNCLQLFYTGDFSRERHAATACREA